MEHNYLSSDNLSACLECKHHTATVVDFGAVCEANPKGLICGKCGWEKPEPFPEALIPTQPCAKPYLCPACQKPSKDSIPDGRTYSPKDYCGCKPKRKDLNDLLVNGSSEEKIHAYTQAAVGANREQKALLDRQPCDKHQKPMCQTALCIHTGKEYEEVCHSADCIPSLPKNCDICGMGNDTHDYATHVKHSMSEPSPSLTEEWEKELKAKFGPYVLVGSKFDYAMLKEVESFICTQISLARRQQWERDREAVEKALMKEETNHVADERILAALSAVKPE